MHVGVLGPVVASRGEVAIPLGAPKQRAVLAALALGRGRAVSADALVDLLWGESASPAAATTLQGYVAGLRKVLEPDRAHRSAASVLVTEAGGYALRLPDDALDVDAFERLVDQAHHALLPLLPLAAGAVPAAAPARTALEEQVGHLDQALRLWRGSPFVELDSGDSVVAERARLDELRLLALEDRATAELALGRNATVVADLEAECQAHPFRERLWALHAAALARAGRQADALAALQRVRERLVDELGLEPGAELRQLQSAVLRQDPALHWQAPTGAVVLPEQRETRPGLPAPGPVPPWPMVGRDAELGALTALLDQAEVGAPAFAALVGEPGIGKSRLSAELAARARTRGADVVVGRCSQDDGAPPLWPWARALEALGRELPEAAGEDDESAAFRGWEQIARTVLESSRERLLVVVLEDLHWADDSSLRVLALLTELATHERLLVIGTWRQHPPPGPRLAAVAEAFARRHAIRLDLHGLDSGEVAQVLTAVAGATPSPAEARALQERSDGNPFFLVEYARLAGEDGDLAALLAESQPPAAVQDVLVRRLASLPDRTTALLRTAAVVGRELDLGVLAGATGTDEDHLLDLLEPAVDAGLLVEEGVGRFRFAHALVRDTAYEGLSPTRRARAHAALARFLSTRAGRESEVARHWLAAGPAHAAEAWHAARAAAASARAVHAHHECAALLTAALEAMETDPAVTARERYDVLVELGQANRWTGDWTDLVAVAERAVDVAEEIGDPELVALAAVSTTIGTLWQSAAYGDTHHAIVAALRRSLERLPATDSALRCRAMLGLANELYYSSGFEERRALVDEAMAMARRIGDVGLLLDACQMAFSAIWRRSTAELRYQLAGEAVQLATRMGRERDQVVAQSLLAVVCNETGRIEEMWQLVHTARPRAVALRLQYSLLVLDTLVVPWLAMAGRFEEAGELVQGLEQAVQRIALPQSDESVAGSVAVLMLWSGRVEPLIAAMQAITESPLPVQHTMAHWMLRIGMLEEARESYRQHPFTDFDADDWLSTYVWCAAAEIALHLEDAALAARAYAKLAPQSGQVCAAGSGASLGPVDAFLAMAAGAAGERELATTHADEALRQMRVWSIPLAEQWFLGQRDRFGF